MRPPTKVSSDFGEGVARKSYFKGYAKSASAKVNSVLGKRKLTTPPFQAGRAPSPVVDASSQAAGNYAKEPQPFRVSFGDTGNQVDDYE